MYFSYTLLTKILNRCQDEIPSPYLIHKQSLRGNRASKEKTHPTQCLLNEISNAFKLAREASGFYAKEQTPPSFHEIRSLGAHLSEQNGMPQEKIQELLGHTDRRMTQLYLDRYGERWVEVEPDTQGLGKKSPKL